MAQEPVPSTPASASAPRPPGEIALARHGEPALSRRVKLDAAGYRRWWAAYEEGGILEGQTPPDGLVALGRRAGAIFVSSRRRALETAGAVVAGKVFLPDPVFVEAPLPPPPLPSFMRFSPRTWGVVARSTWWWLRYCPPPEENRAAAEARAREACDRLVRAAETQGDVLLIAHGFFNAMLTRELKRRGWRKVEDRGFGYWAVKRFRRR